MFVHDINSGKHIEAYELATIKVAKHYHKCTGVQQDTITIMKVIS